MEVYMKKTIQNYIQNKSSLFENLYYFDSIDSTNTRALKIQDKFNSLVVAEKQSAGKGRYDRKWESPENENLYFSIRLYKPELKYNQFCILISTCIYEVLKSYNEEIKIKWPNDIIYKEKKICGILNEQTFSGDKIESTVLGVGINLFTDFTHYKDLSNIAVSLKNITKQEIKPVDILINISKVFEQYYLNYKKEEKNIIEKWKSNIYHKEKIIQFKNHDQIIKGELINIHSNGSIDIKLDNRIKNCTFGEIV
jgi:BirA family biotin operon repressor/biotin-[acetyl-CoA-carboxylase] ligase